MNRRRAREYALQMLFQFDFTENKSFAEIPAISLEEDGQGKFSGEAEAVKTYAEELFRGTVTNREEIDRAIQSAAEHWEMGRMMAVDRNILRLSAYELLYRKDIPPAVAIDEALEIAKKYSSQESASFINGLLDRIAKSVREKTQ